VSVVYEAERGAAVGLGVARGWMRGAGGLSASLRTKVDTYRPGEESAGAAELHRTGSLHAAFAARYGSGGAGLQCTALGRYAWLLPCTPPPLVCGRAGVAAAGRPRDARIGVAAATLQALSNAARDSGLPLSAVLPAWNVAVPVARATSVPCLASVASPLASLHLTAVVSAPAATAAILRRPAATAVTAADLEHCDLALRAFWAPGNSIARSGVFAGGPDVGAPAALQTVTPWAALIEADTGRVPLYCAPTRTPTGLPLPLALTLATLQEAAAGAVLLLQATAQGWLAGDTVTPTSPRTGNVGTHAAVSIAESVSAAALVQPLEDDDASSLPMVDAARPPLLSAPSHAGSPPPGSRKTSPVAATAATTAAAAAAAAAGMRTPEPARRARLALGRTPSTAPPRLPELLIALAVRLPMDALPPSTRPAARMTAAVNAAMLAARDAAEEWGVLARLLSAAASAAVAPFLPSLAGEVAAAATASNRGALWPAIVAAIARAIAAALRSSADLRLLAQAAHTEAAAMDATGGACPAAVVHTLAARLASGLVLAHCWNTVVVALRATWDDTSSAALAEGGGATMSGAPPHRALDMDWGAPLVAQHAAVLEYATQVATRIGVVAPTGGGAGASASPSRRGSEDEMDEAEFVDARSPGDSGNSDDEGVSATPPATPAATGAAGMWLIGPLLGASAGGSNTLRRLVPPPVLASMPPVPRDAADDEGAALAAAGVSVAELRVGEDVLRRRRATVTIPDGGAGVVVPRLVGGHPPLLRVMLRSDMDAFRRANPGAHVVDFLRWYLPSAWRPCTGGGCGLDVAAAAPRARLLHARMCGALVDAAGGVVVRVAADDNVSATPPTFDSDAYAYWHSLWTAAAAPSGGGSSKAPPAELFNPLLAAELSLAFLERVTLPEVGLAVLGAALADAAEGNARRVHAAAGDHLPPLQRVAATSGAVASTAVTGLVEATEALRLAWRPTALARHARAPPRAGSAAPPLPSLSPRPPWMSPARGVAAIVRHHTFDTPGEVTGDEVAVGGMATVRRRRGGSPHASTLAASAVGGGGGGMSSAIATPAPGSRLGGRSLLAELASPPPSGLRPPSPPRAAGALFREESDGTGTLQLATERILVATRAADAVLAGACLAAAACAADVATTCGRVAWLSAWLHALSPGAEDDDGSMAAFVYEVATSAPPTTLPPWHAGWRVATAASVEVEMPPAPPPLPPHAAPLLHAAAPVRLRAVHSAWHAPATEVVVPGSAPAGPQSLWSRIVAFAATRHIPLAANPSYARRVLGWSARQQAGAGGGGGGGSGGGNGGVALGGGSGDSVLTPTLPSDGAAALAATAAAAGSSSGAAGGGRAQERARAREAEAAASGGLGVSMADAVLAFGATCDEARGLLEQGAAFLPPFAVDDALGALARVATDAIGVFTDGEEEEEDDDDDAAAGYAAIPSPRYSPAALAAVLPLLADVAGPSACGIGVGGAGARAASARVPVAATAARALRRAIALHGGAAGRAAAVSSVVLGATRASHDGGPASGWLRALGWDDSEAAAGGGYDDGAALPRPDTATWVFLVGGPDGIRARTAVTYAEDGSVAVGETSVQI